jgi:outer membrane protein assembly factor BamB
MRTLSPSFQLFGFAVICLLLTVLCAGVAAQTDVATYHNDISRTGQNLNETILTPGNVNSASFGLLFNLTVDSDIDAQPLVISGLTIHGATHNVLYAVTENDSVYAFDSDTGSLLWKVSVLLPGEQAGSTKPLACNQINPSIGITATPVIDRKSGPNGAIYLVAMSENSSGTYFQRLHALDLTTGAELFNGPATIQGQYPGNGPNSVGGFLTFNPQIVAERSGLLLVNGVIYMGFTSHCDNQPYNGWFFGYSESTLAQTAILNLTPNGTEGAIWMAGAAPASDGTNIYLLDANGTFDTTLTSSGFPSLGDYGNAFLKIAPSGTVADYFAMDNTVIQSEKDRDFGSGGVLLLPPQTDLKGNKWNLAVGAGKDGNIYILNQANLGKFSPTSNRVYQEVQRVLGSGMWAMPAYFNGNLYFGPQLGNMLQFTLTNAKLSTRAAAQTPTVFEFPGTIPSVSANGSTSGIVWGVEHALPSILHAYNATSVATELYNSNQAADNRDHFGKASHFGVPTIVNGKVYVGSTNSVAVFGLLSTKSK